MEKNPCLAAKIRDDIDIISTFVKFFFPYLACVSRDCVGFDMMFVMHL